MIETHSNQLIARRHLGIAVALWGMCSWAAPPPKVIDRAVASIEGRVVTLSQLQFEARVMLVAAGGVQAAFAPLDAAALRAALTTAVDHRLSLIEPDKLGAYLLESGEVERAVTAFRERFESEARFNQFLAAHEADLVELGQILSRSLRAQRALEGKFRLRAQASEADARAYQSAHPEMKGVALETVRSVLVQQRFNDLVKRELAEQRAQFEVRLLGPFAPQPSAP